jgi:hypothetical protein
MVLIHGKALEIIERYVFKEGKWVKERDWRRIGDVTADVEYVVYIRPLPREFVEEIISDMDAGAGDKHKSLIEFVFYLVSGEFWRDPLKGAFRTTDNYTAYLLAKIIALHHGCAWMIGTDNTIYVWSKGYYYCESR